ncbi:MAG: IPExxxVDY family protein [Bacteroidales bacterium]|nr:IPExxxVDY family protein [Bacteroidales bacterium]
MAKKIFLDSRSEPNLFTLFGISCHLKDFRLSYLLNIRLGLELVKMEDFCGYSFYYCRDEDRFNAYYLLGNRGQEAILLPDLKQTDFLLLVEGPFKKAQKERLLEKIRGIQHVLTAFEVRFETIKNYQLILSDLELHLMNIKMETKIKYSPLKK